MRLLILFSFLVMSVLLSCVQKPDHPNQTKLSLNKISIDKVSINKNELLDKIKGGWAGQVIGCTYGGPTEFKYCGTMIQDYIPIEWDENRMIGYYESFPGLYDDIYMDLTFVEVFEKEGLDAPATSHAKAFANADYKLWHANQAARYNILNGIDPPASGHWENNPHSDDIDFQIEADFAGLMSPGMPNTASEICDKVGHIMNYGDGWYGGVYVASMYSLAFISDNVEFIVNEALKSIPEQSDFYQCIADVIGWHQKYPEDWKRTWFECEKKWSSDIGCPDGVFRPFNIDAKINAAYIIIGMLYGNGDYGKSIEISTRCGQDSDCNPSSVAGILGTMLGYSNIPEYWKQGLDKVEDLNFKYTSYSLNDVYKMSYNHAIQNIKINGGKINLNKISLLPQRPATVKFEKGFANHVPVKITTIKPRQRRLDNVYTKSIFEFNGTGFVIKGSSRADNDSESNYKQIIEVHVDGKLSEKAYLPIDFTKRRHEISWNYNLDHGKHVVTIKLLNPKKGYHVYLNEILIYDNQP